MERLVSEKKVEMFKALGYNVVKTVSGRGADRILMAKTEKPKTVKKKTVKKKIKPDMPEAKTDARGIFVKNTRRRPTPK